METTDLEALIIRSTSRVPVPAGPPGDGTSPARQFDAVLMCAGFKCSQDLLARLGRLEAGTVIDLAVRVLPVVREMAGDHVRHNTYFKDFPAGVPDTAEFWAQCLREAVMAQVPGSSVTLGARELAELGRAGFVLNLLSLPSYGSYQHSYDDMLASHAELIPAISDRMTVLHAGGTAEDEARALYSRLAGGAVPLSAADTDSLRTLARLCADMEQPETIPARESRAVINAARLMAGAAPLVTTVTDVLRLACELSGGDVSLQERTRFRSLPRRHREALMTALDSVAVEPKLADVNQYAEQWKRLGERLHPHEYPYLWRAVAVFAVARGEKAARSLAGQAEAAFREGSPVLAASRLAVAPGMLWRSADRLLRSADPGDLAGVVAVLGKTAPDVAGRVLLSVREHLQNRTGAAYPSRVFANRRGRAMAVAEARGRLDSAAVRDVSAAIDAEIMSRLPRARIVHDAGILGAALPLSGKPLPEGLGVFPRGSVTKVDGELLRFFTYWQERKQRTDYDLSALFLDREYGNPRQVSWTRLRGDGGAVHSGDITSARDGASEFIDIPLKGASGFIVPQVYIYAGEGFREAAEAFFGFMTRDALQQGQPFEARTVRMKSALFGESRVAVPLVFMRRDDGHWYAKWLHLYMRGHAAEAFDARTNQVEGGYASASLLARAVVEREYLRTSYLLDLWRQKGCEVLGALPEDGSPVTWIGLEEPEELPDGSEAFTLARLGGLIPA